MPKRNASSHSKEGSPPSGSDHHKQQVGYKHRTNSSRRRPLVQQNEDYCDDLERITLDETAQYYQDQLERKNKREELKKQQALEKKESLEDDTYLETVNHKDYHNDSQNRNDERRLHRQQSEKQDSHRPRRERQISEASNYNSSIEEEEYHRRRIYRHQSEAQLLDDRGERKKSKRRGKLHRGFSLQHEAELNPAAIQRNLSEGEDYSSKRKFSWPSRRLVSFFNIFV